MDELHKRIQSNFNKQGLMKTLNASLDRGENGLVRISCIYHEGLSQQHNFFHAGKTLTVCEGNVYDVTETKLIARMTATIIVKR